MEEYIQFNCNSVAVRWTAYTSTLIYYLLWAGGILEEGSKLIDGNFSKQQLYTNNLNLVLRRWKFIICQNVKCIELMSGKTWRRRKFTNLRRITNPKHFEFNKFDISSNFFNIIWICNIFLFFPSIIQILLQLSREFCRWSPGIKLL